ncbi:hypothetical protein HDG40_007985 [Paraburkholderia sp. JPY158]|uniref:Uncharacterized protein n=1 Tax=Paraburkholderia atlantica TaxID=2654982 RepID=A0A7W8QFX8_PARAM|nr:hypothetical protein [Paraburkholderia atlantica]
MREPAEVSDKFDAYLPNCQHQRIQPYTFGAALRAHAQRGAQSQPARSVEQLDAAHAGPAGRDELGDRSWERFWCAVSWQREGD